MGYTGLVPCEYSSGQRIWRGHTRQSRIHPRAHRLDRSGLGLPVQPAIGTTLRRRQHGAPPETIARSAKAQRRLHGKYAAMTARGKAAPEAATAIARELAGFVWAEMTS
jgi:transposase